MSRVTFHGVASLHSFDAGVGKFTGEATIPEGHPEAARGKLVLEVSSIDTHIRRRNDEMFKRLEPDKYPLMTFLLDAREFLPNMTEDGRVIEDLASGESKCALHGKLEFHGRTHAVEGKGHCSDLAGGGRLVEGEAPVDMTDYGITPPRLGIIKMEPVVRVEYKLAFRKAP